MGQHSVLGDGFLCEGTNFGQEARCSRYSALIPLFSVRNTYECACFKHDEDDQMFSDLREAAYMEFGLSELRSLKYEEWDIALPPAFGRPCKC